MHHKFTPWLAMAPLLFSLSAQAGIMDKAKSAKDAMDKAANAPVKVSIDKGYLFDNKNDLKKVFAAFKKKIGSDPLMVYSARISWTNDVNIVYQNRYNLEKLETLSFSKGEIAGKPGKFTLIGKDAKVANSIIDFGRVKIDAIPDLVRLAREKTAEAAKVKKTAGASVDIVQLWTPGQPTQIRIVVHVAADDKSAAALVGEALTSLKDDKVAKGSSVGELVADETGKVLEFKLK